MPKAKRTSQYHKLMQRYATHFGFKAPYQVLVDSDFANAVPMGLNELKKQFENLLGAKVGVKAIKSCANKPPGPFVVATCSKDGAKFLYDNVPGVPMITINSQNVMILLPYSEASQRHEEEQESKKLSAGLNGTQKTALGKRKRDGEEQDDKYEDKQKEKKDVSVQKPKKEKKHHGPKQPNPLSMKKPKKRAVLESRVTKARSADRITHINVSAETAPKRKKRKRKSSARKSSPLAQS